MQLRLDTFSILQFRFEATYPYKARCYCKVNTYVRTYSYTAVPPIWNAILLQFLHQYEAHTVPFTVSFQNVLHHFARSSANWKVEIKKFYFIN